MATHSSSLAWKIPWTEEPGRLWYMGSQRVIEVARLLLDSGAQVNMPADSFESPLTLAACGGHVELAALLIERGASLEEVNDEGYTPLMEAAREGHEEMVALLLGQGNQYQSRY